MRSVLLLPCNSCPALRPSQLHVDEGVLAELFFELANTLCDDFQAHSSCMVAAALSSLLLLLPHSASTKSPRTSEADEC